MIISHGRKYIFVHIPKTGGTSLALALESKAMKDDILIGNTPKAKQRKKRLAGVQTEGRLWKHSRLVDVYGLVSQAEMEAYFVFTLVRNPWDRLVSYYHWLRDQTFDSGAVKLAQSLEFSGFLNHGDTVESVRNSPDLAYVCDRGGVDRCDLYVRFEHLSEDLARLEAHLEFRLPPLEKTNRSVRARDYRGYYSDADATLVGQICAADIARMDYKFDDFV